METAYKLSREYLGFCSSMPYLRQDEPAPISTENFLRQASTVIEQEDYLFLADLTFDSCVELASIKEPLNEYFQWEVALRNRLASHRHAHPLPMDHRLEQGHAREFTLLIGGVGLGVDALLHECLALNPLQAEQRLHAARWERLDFTKGIHHSDLVFLSVYRLQLLLLEAQQRWQPEPGERRYYDTCQAILRRSKGSFA